MMDQGMIKKLKQRYLLLPLRPSKKPRNRKSSHNVPTWAAPHRRLASGVGLIAAELSKEALAAPSWTEW